MRKKKPECQSLKKNDSFKKEESLQNQTLIKTAVELSGLSFAHTLSVGRLAHVAVETEPENREPAA